MAEGSHSGLVRLVGGELCQKWHREFESRPLRHVRETCTGEKFTLSLSKDAQVVAKITKALGVSIEDLLK